MKILITGATRGIGQAAAVALAKGGADLILVAREAARAEETLAALRAAGSGRHDVVMCDLSSQVDIRRLAGELRQKHPAIDVLVNNAGGIFPKRKTTVDGIEWTFALNHLSYFLLTNLLRGVITKRVVSTSSGAHLNGKLDLDDLQWERRWYDWFGLKPYATSKLCNILFTRELARRLEGSGVTANCFHPGFVRSGFGHHEGGVVDWGLKLTRPFQLSVEEGADTLVWLATSDEPAAVSGEYFIKRKIRKGSPASRDAELAKKLWAASEKLTGISA